MIKTWPIFSRGLCSRLIRLLRNDTENGSDPVANGSQRILNAPVHMASMNTSVETGESSSIWIQKIEDNLVNQPLFLNNGCWDTYLSYFNLLINCKKGFKKRKKINQKESGKCPFLKKLWFSEGRYEETGTCRAAAAEEAWEARRRQLDRQLLGLLQGQWVWGWGDGDAGHQPTRGERLRGRQRHQRHPDRKLWHFFWWQGKLMNGSLFSFATRLLQKGYQPMWRFFPYVRFLKPGHLWKLRRLMNFYCRSK